MGASVFEFVRTMLVLVLVIGLLLLLARLARKFQVAGGKLVTKPTGQIDVVSRRSLGKHMSLLVIRVSNRTFLVGQSSQQVTMLTELASSEEQSEHMTLVPAGAEEVLIPGTVSGSEVNAAGAWDAFVDRLRELTVRR